MDEECAFQDLIRRVRRGDESAAADLVRTYEPEIRRVIRLRLTDPHLRRILDSVDIAQSVLANFFVRVSLGQFTLDHPDQLIKLLVTMARNKLLNLARNQKAQRRGRDHRQAVNPEVLEGVADSSETPSQIVAYKELVQVARRNLTKEERYLADQRAIGRSWAAIADEIGGNPDALRKRLVRATERISRLLGLQEEADD